LGHRLGDHKTRDELLNRFLRRMKMLVASRKEGMNMQQFLVGFNLIPDTGIR